MAPDSRGRWCCVGFCSNGGSTGGYRVHVGSEAPTVAGTIALGLLANLGVMQLDTLLSQVTSGGRDGFVERPPGGPARARRATFLLSIPTSAPDLPLGNPLRIR